MGQNKVPWSEFAEWAGGPLFICAKASQDKGLPGSAEDIVSIIEPSLEAMGYRLVRVAFLGARRATLQVMAERIDDAPMTVDDCTEISRSVSALLDVADPIAGAYTLEVSSPGIDRPLTRPEDYDRFAGFEAKIELGRPLDGRKRFRGRILGRVPDATDFVRLVDDAGEVRLPLADIAKAKLVITNDLLAARSTPLH
jgi:ribosome maturation factor RimP